MAKQLPQHRRRREGLVRLFELPRLRQTIFKIVERHALAGARCYVDHLMDELAERGWGMLTYADLRAVIRVMAAESQFRYRARDDTLSM